MPRAKYTKPPEPLPAIEQVQRSKFRFRNEQRRKLTELLPYKLAHSDVPPSDAASANLPPNVKTIADGVIQATEDVIISHPTVSNFSKSSMNSANVRAAIRRLREALKPFVSVSVDNETANIVPADLDSKLASREQQLAKLRLPGERQRTLAYSCQLIALAIRGGASKTGETIGEQEILRYVDMALNFARIKHPNISKHRNRLAVLVFPKVMPPHSQG